jgi:hypothetical protein
MSARLKPRTAAVNGRLWGARARDWAAPRASPLPWIRVVFTFVDDLREAPQAPREWSKSCSKSYVPMTVWG